MKRLLATASIGFTAMIAAPAPAQAASEAACAIWLCLPAGFPSGCSAAHSEFKHRIKKGRPPLPDFASCAVGGSTGNYQMGYERLESCKDGYEERDTFFRHGVHHKNACISTACNTDWSGTSKSCKYYVRELRAKPNYVKMWVDGDFIGQYWF